MTTILQWWQRRRLLARLRQVREQEAALIAEHSQIMERLNQACQELIKYKSYVSVYAPKVAPTRDRVNSLSIQLNMLGVQIDHYQSLADQLQQQLAIYS